MPIEPGKAAITRDPVLVDLALQGGGSHGAFTWGVLDRLLEEPWLGIDGISVTSAGAMDAGLLANVRRHGSHVAPAFALSIKSEGKQAIARDSGRSRRFRAASAIV